MTQRRILLFTLFMTLVFNAAYGGIELRSKQMRTSDGLPNNSVRYLYQDSKGFLWLATLNGLSRYDGNSFLTFRPEIGDKVSLADNRIYDLTEDKNGFLWISTTPELFSCYDLQRACFVDYTGSGALEKNYSSIFVAANGWVGRLPQFKAGCWHSCSRNSTLFVVKASTDYTFRNKWEYNYRRNDENEGRRACATLHTYAYFTYRDSPLGDNSR